MITAITANSTVSDLPRAEEWYARFFGRGPDRRPMDGLLEWRLGDTLGLQVWAEPARAGGSTVVFQVTELDAAAARMTELGIGHAGPQPGGGARILQLTDPDGNRVILTGD